MTIVTRMPGKLLPAACRLSKLPRCAPIRKPPWPLAMVSSQPASPLIVMSKACVWPRTKYTRSSTVLAKVWK